MLASLTYQVVLPTQTQTEMTHKGKANKVRIQTVLLCRLQQCSTTCCAFYGQTVTVQKKKVLVAEHKVYIQDKYTPQSCEY